MTENGIYKLKLFRPNGDYIENEIEIDNNYTNDFPNKTFIYCKLGYIEYYNKDKQQRESTNCPYILTYDKSL